MLFNSFQFLQFLFFTTAFFFILPFRWRAWFLLVCSYYFYGCWNADYLALIFTTTVSTFIIGRAIGNTEGRRKRQAFVFIVCLINFGILGFFKYANFFSESWNAVFGYCRIDIHLPMADFLLPVGISFYTFQAIGYVVDVYRKKVEPETSLARFALYISFFPQLVAGPIERSWQLLPQFSSRLKFDYEKILNGIMLILWGFFQKIVIADRLAMYVDNIYKMPNNFSSVQLLVALYFFSFQIYCDFAGYSNIAIGTAKLFGIDLMRNFNRPYFSDSIQTFWRRWHISLSTWFKDYLYIPLGGNRVRDNRLVWNIMVVFLLCGLWHGAAWNYVIWGGIHGLLLCVQIFFSRYGANSMFRVSIPRYIKVLFTFHIVTFAWIFFRAPSLKNAAEMISGLTHFTIQSNELLKNTGLNGYEFTLSIIFIAILIGVEKMQQEQMFNEFWARRHYAYRVIIPQLLFFSIIIFGMFNLSEFIYFQF